MGRKRKKVLLNSDAIIETARKFLKNLEDCENGKADILVVDDGPDPLYGYVSVDEDKEKGRKNKKVKKD